MFTPLEVGLIATTAGATVAAAIAISSALYWREGHFFWRERARAAEDLAQANLLTLQRRGRRIAELEAALETHSPG